ncbi:uncharacterized protein LOC131650508 [Vicia villosa]|uniref:uncharacterized protein LOC131650508 n=1 Tax=Vicia villosa TaxID=3911 RepID=UPI00273B8F86|nr:uncharacterized protein LOC131650508 [Vicia villosa]
MLSCVPFKFLGLPVGANHRRKETWEPVLSKLESRLSSWQGRHLSLGGKVTLINSVLNNIPIFWLSFFKTPKVVWEEITRIQRSFLWGKPKDDKRRMAWVSWDKVCLSKEDGGLGVKNVELFNLALISKWGWRCLEDRQCVWSHILAFRYGGGEQRIREETSSYRLQKASLWWRDIRTVCRGKVNDQCWFLDAVSQNTDGEVVWDSGNDGFSVKNVYTRLYSSWCEAFRLDVCKVQVILSVWRAKVPESVKCFGWRFILNSIPTREELGRRGVLLGSDSVVCPLYNRVTESKEHLFLLCTESAKVWKKVLFWLVREEMDIGIGILEMDIFELFSSFLEVCVRAPLVPFFWLLISWNIWRARNELVFSNKVWDVSRVVNCIKSMGWEWFFFSYQRARV